MRLGTHARCHDPAAALVVDGTTVAGPEEERPSRRERGERPVPCSAGARLAGGPRTRDETTNPLVTGALVPPVAPRHRLTGEWRRRAAAPWREVAP